MSLICFLVLNTKLLIKAMHAPVCEESASPKRRAERERALDAERCERVARGLQRESPDGCHELAEPAGRVERAKGELAAGRERESVAEVRGEQLVHYNCKHIAHLCNENENTSIPS